MCPKIWKVELRLSMIEALLSFFWVFISVGAALAATTCVAGCPASAAMGQHTGKAMPCPPPTFAIQVSLATGFAAAVVSGLSYSPMKSEAQNERSIPDAITSGAHFNPVVTLSLAARGHISWSRMLTFCSAQLLGSFLAGEALVGIVGKSCFLGSMEVAPKRMISDGPAIGVHAILSAMIALIHIWTHERLQSMATPVMIGFAYIAGCLMQVQLAGHEAPNPLRSFVLSALGAGDGHTTADAWVGSVLGGLAAASVDVLLFSNNPLWHKSNGSNAQGEICGNTDNAPASSNQNSHKTMAMSNAEQTI